MIVTDVKIKVTEEMMFRNGLSYFLCAGKLGVPFSKEKKEPIKWCYSLTEMTQEDFDKIEEYFLHQRKPLT